ncbi:MAG: hypothetical protein AB7S38_31975 [Vulcanimicrobiota bacterium]
MKRIVGILTLVTLALTLAGSLAPQSAEAQLLLVTGRYRVVSVERAEQRIGVALPEDDPKVRQNWVYLKPDTVMVRRNYYKGGYFKDEVITYNSMFEVLSNHRGELVKIHGGRDWDGSIDAKKVWM